jgi:protein-tyrosine-phosphatase
VLRTQAGTKWPKKKKLTDWHLDDPKGKPVEEVRRIRDMIEPKVRMLSEELTRPSAKTT